MKSIFAAVLVVLAFSLSPAAVAQSGRLLTVSGEAEVEVPPDFVRLEALIAADDEHVLERAALEGAAREAKLKAEAIATGLGIQLGTPVEVGENGLTPSLTIRQRAAGDMEFEEIVVMASSRAIAEPMMFVPENILVRAVVAVWFEIVGE